MPRVTAASGLRHVTFDDVSSETLAHRTAVESESNRIVLTTALASVVKYLNTQVFKYHDWYLKTVINYSVKFGYLNSI